MLRVSRRLLPILISGFSGWLYLRTLSPGLTWAYDGADGGDLLSALATGGVPHPTGYPTYLLTAALFTEIPFGTLAWRANLFSALCMFLAVFVFYKLVLTLSRSLYAASLSALLFGTFPLVWSQAVITEIYALQALLSFLVLYFFLPEENPGWRDFGGGAVMGLALGNHLTSIFLLPFLFIPPNIREHRSVQCDFPAHIWLPSRLYLEQLGKRWLGLFSGLLVYIAIPLRAANQAPINWGNPIDWDGFWWLVSGAMYQGRLQYLSSDYLTTSLRLWSGFLLEQIGLIGFIVALFYVVITFRPDCTIFTTVYLTAIYSLFSIVYYSPDSYVYLILPLGAFAIWIGLGCSCLLQNLPAKVEFLKPWLMIGFLVVVVVRAAWMIPAMDISKDKTAEEYALAVFDALPPDAIVITNGDEDTFTLWYFQYAEGLRPDISIVWNNLATQAWYSNMLSAAYPDLKIPAELLPQNLAAANPNRPVCRLTMDLKPHFKCLQPGNQY